MKKITSRLSSLGLDALLVTSPLDITYLTGFYFQGVMLLVPVKGIPLYFIDTMNFALAEKKLKGKRLRIVSEPGALIKTLSGYVRDQKIRKIGINAHAVPLSTYQGLLKLSPKVKFVSRVKDTDTSEIISDMRLIKSPEEIAILKRAAKKTVGIWRKVKKKLQTGMSEKEIATLVDKEVIEAGCSNSFPTIAAIGVNTAFPHAVPTGRRLKKKEHVLVDFGIMYKGYCSDLTRTWDNGRIDGQIRDFRKIVLRAHDLAIKSIKPGALVGFVTTRAYNILNIGTTGKFILHGLGHGVGLEVHERPFLRAGSRERLKKGMVVTVEPGLYKPALGGIREEDMVVVTEKGCEVLTV